MKAVQNVAQIIAIWVASVVAVATGATLALIYYFGYGF